MSYILNALRKSEQERQANQPETVTEQVLMPSPQKSRKTVLLVGGLLAVNLLAFPLAVWFLKKADDAPAKPQAAPPPVQKKAAPKPLLPAAAKPVDDQAGAEQEAEVAPAVATPPAQESKRLKISPAGMPSPKALSIEELAAEKQAEERKAGKQAPGDRKASSDHSVQTALAPPIAEISRREQLRQKIQARRAERTLAAENENPPEVDGVAAPENKADAAPATAKQDIPLFKDLPYDFRSSAPKLSINVFKYDDKPEDSFVVLNMTKYKAGQTTKDSVEIKEIRSDSVVASYGGKVFRIERP